MKRFFLFIILPVLFAPEAIAQSSPSQVAEQFAQALGTGDRTTVERLLDPQVLIYETGSQEASLAEYASHHLPADMAFMAKLKRSMPSRQEGAAGDLAWVSTRTRLTGSYKDKPVDLFSTESLVLKRVQDGWRIVHVHWSSAPVDPKPKK